MHRDRALTPTTPPPPAAQVWIGRWQAFINTTLKNGERVTAESLKELEAGQKGDAPARRATVDAPAAVADLSAWLAGFSAENFPRAQRIEVPGQYDACTGRAPPDATAHALVASVEPRLRTMASLREPKRVAFVAHTEAVFPFLAKVGEGGGGGGGLGD